MLRAFLMPVPVVLIKAKMDQFIVRLHHKQGEMSKREQNSEDSLHEIVDRMVKVRVSALFVGTTNVRKTLSPTEK